MYIVLHGTAQTPVGKAQNQAQNELKQTRIGHHGSSSNHAGKSSKQGSR